MKSDRRLIGTVAFVQVQQRPLKRASVDGRIYNPASLVRVDALRLTNRGVVGLLEGEEETLDAHHADHPESRFKGVNGISIGFSAHYDSMRLEYGDHLVTGIAGENIIVQSELAPTVADLKGKLVFENPDGSILNVTCPQAMPPCDEFSHFARRATGRLGPTDLKETLRFLDEGRRGFHLLLDDGGDAVLYPGARLFQQDI